MPRPSRNKVEPRKGLNADGHGSEPEADAETETERDESPDAVAEEAFIESLIATGQAAPLDEDGKLPPGATHELIESDEGELKAVRRRFSLF